MSFQLPLSGSLRCTGVLGIPPSSALPPSMVTSACTLSLGAEEREGPKLPKNNRYSLDLPSNCYKQFFVYDYSLIALFNS